MDAVFHVIFKYNLRNKKKNVEPDQKLKILRTSTNVDSIKNISFENLAEGE
jgi:hypothetical protein